MFRDQTSDVVKFLATTAYVVLADPCIITCHERGILLRRDVRMPLAQR